MPSWIVDIG